MGKHMKGTQEMLDAAKDDATLLPFDTVFVTRRNELTSQSYMPNGVKVVRCATIGDGYTSVAFFDKSGNFWFCDATDLIPAKKSKPKKWQNGTQKMLNAATDDARLIPKKTYFRSLYGETNGYIVYRVDSPRLNKKFHVLMAAKDVELLDYHIAERLEPIND